MYTSIKALSLAALAGLAAAAPSGGAQVTVKNQCGSDLHVGQLTNGESQANVQVISQGTQKNYDLPSDWQGRFWARSDCDGDACSAIAGAAAPASLAEITFKGHAGYDYYDLSFVDGFNLPIKFYPVNGNKDSDDQYRCGAPACGTVPSCPEDEMKVYGSDGQVVGCKSACSAYGTDEFCCAGAHNLPSTCSPNQYSKAVKDACPDAYSYAYDDTTSTYMCKADTYELVFCP
ncbi:thaumatin [Zychaea mexicana]|uniref:thaumatin n=1 Tax=Zychaea mexicana TaxID=64656 RepID=UPI0022FE4573|nr:thaumatin [Zychaea mexicana]KAI9496500.1 thaumatin [Zychaea mexicana]